MSHVAEFTVPPESFPFGRSLVELRNVEIEVDQIIPTDESALPFFWVRGCEPAAFMEYAEREAAVRDTRKLEQVGQVALFRAEWRPDAELVAALRSLDVTLVRAVGTADHWLFEVRTEDVDTFNRFREAFEAQGVPVTLERLFDLEEVLEGDRRSLTDEQRETLVTALEEGYWDKPRGVTQADLAELFDVSRRAVAERLRRGTRNLVAESLPPSEERGR